MFLYDNLKFKIKNLSPEELELRGVINPDKTNANNRKTYICPICGNGTGKGGDGIAFKYEGGAWLAKCFKCGKGFDNFILLALHYGLDARADFVEICRRAVADFSLSADFETFHNLQPSNFSRPNKIEYVQPVKSPAEIENDKKLIEAQKLEKKYIAQILTLPDNLDSISKINRRGLSVETLRHFHCIYTENWIHPKVFAEYKVGLRDKLPARSRRIIIPTADGNHYNAVLVDSDRTDNNKNFWKIHAGKKSVPFGIETIKGEENPHAEGEIINFTDEELENIDEDDPLDFLKYTMKIFGAHSAVKISDDEDDFAINKEMVRLKNIITATEAVIVVEGEFDAMTAWQGYQQSLINNRDKPAGRAFIATGGAAERNWINEVDNRCKQLKIKPLFIIAFDDDDAGKNNAPKCADELKKLGYTANVKFNI